jgi:uncharacterized protein (DUF1684 family)
MLTTTVTPTIDDVTSSEADTLETPHASQAARSAAAAGREAWRDARLAAVTSAQGNLALIETRWLTADDEVSDADALAGHPETVTVTRLERTNLETGEPERGIRLWDSHSAAIAHFQTVTLFDFDRDWVIEAEFTPVASGRTVAFEHIRDNGGTRELVVPGDITFTLDGVEHRLSAFDDGGVLLLVFGDPTNGSDEPTGTYASGRFLFVERPTGDAHFDSAGTVVLDFNKAVVPPCGFSNQYNCPLPPRNNRFDVAVTAGEKRVVFVDGFDAH